MKVTDFYITISVFISSFSTDCRHRKWELSLAFVSLYCLPLGLRSAYTPIASPFLYVTVIEMVVTSLNDPMPKYLMQTTAGINVFCTIQIPLPVATHFVHSEIGLDSFVGAALENEMSSKVQALDIPATNSLYIFIIQHINIYMWPPVYKESYMVFSSNTGTPTFTRARKYIQCVAYVRRSGIALPHGINSHFDHSS